jgi:iron complex transport system substrate-binding protein
MAPPRIVSLIAFGSETLCALGCGEWLVGRSQECDYPVAVRGLPVVAASRESGLGGNGSVPVLPGGVEGLAASPEGSAPTLTALRPDIVISAPAGRAPGGADGPAGFRRVAVGPRTLAEVYRDIRRVAEAVGVPERGLQLVTRLRTRLEAVAARAAGSGPRLRVACVEWLDPLTAAGGWTPELVAMAGGDDLFGAPGRDPVVLRWEDLAAADPDLLLVAPRGRDLAQGRADLRGLAARPGWSGLRAVQGERVYLVDGASCFGRPGPRLAEALEILAEVLHPGAFRFGHEGTGWERWQQGTTA